MKMIPAVVTVPEIKPDSLQYWTTPFSTKDSLERIKRFERRSRLGMLLSGLELTWAKIHLAHGAWYPFLWEANMVPSTATRRMAIARGFMVWVGLATSTRAPVGDAEVRQAIAAARKPCILHDFEEWLLQASEDDRLREFSPRERSPLTPGVPSIFGFHMHTLLGKVDARMRNARRWKPEDYSEAIEMLRIFEEQLQVRRQSLEEMLSNRLERDRRKRPGRRIELHSWPGDPLFNESAVADEPGKEA
jgi:hypothetical protein